MPGKLFRLGFLFVAVCGWGLVAGGNLTSGQRAAEEVTGGAFMVANIAGGIRRAAVSRPETESFEKIREIQLETTENNLIQDITDFDIDGKDNFILCDGWQAKDVFVFSARGDFLRPLGRTGQGPGEYSAPVSAAVGPNGDIWVADYMANKVILYDEYYRFKRSFVCRPRIRHYIHVNQKNELFAYSGTTMPKSMEFWKIDAFDTIHKFDQQGRETASFAPFPEEALDIPFMSVQDGMTIDDNDNIYEMNALYYRINKFSADGESLGSFSRKTDLFRIILPKGDRQPIIVNGPFYIKNKYILAQVSEHLEVYDTDGRFVAGEIPFPFTILGAGGDNLYVALWAEEDNPEVLSNPKIVVYRCLF
jgi:hypothetical protein